MKTIVVKKFWILLTAVLAATVTKAEYPVSSIPEGLLKKADVIKRLDEIYITVRNSGRAFCRLHYVYTILNEAGNRHAGLVMGYDKFNVINEISGVLYNAEGKKIKTVKKKDIQDVSGTDGASLITDARYKVYDFYCREYPYTVEYDVTFEMNGIFSFPEWMPQSRPRVSVESSRLVFDVPKNYKLRYKMFLYNGQPEIKDNKNSQTYTWQLTNVAARAEELYAPEWNQLVTRVLTAPSDFEIGGYKGNMDTWQNFGKFTSMLYVGRDVLPETVKAKVQELIKDIKTDREKVGVLYRYMQQNSRYISIQLGIGGWQPLDAAYVAEKKYGDCKALSNYMVALLKEAGIKAYVALIIGGSDDKDVVSDFSSNQFNHAVVCVPADKDSIWLECTSQTVEPGYMGSFTGNREALLISDMNSRLVRTPVYSQSKNIQHRVIDASLDANGNLTASVVTNSTGLLQDDLHSVIHDLTNEEKQKRLRNEFSLPNYEIGSFVYKEAGSNNLPAVIEKVQLVSKDYASVTGKRLFINPNILSRHGVKLTEDEQRQNEIVYEYGFRTADTVTIKIPPGYSVEAMPKPVQMDNAFGTYSIQYSYKDGIITMIRRYDRNSGRFPPGDYQKMVTFYNAVYKADRARMVLVKGEE
ncbi:hypothetical protein A8C56_23405 [Niabella ginsenosidivorans]|uniref:DUF3857 domain-containing protein n=1 Tax=Niabella ginsenosidivorans TaxID=1176587 RepID=A0A1A9I9X2_9BACT|nr:DUF3857 domain-containing transglutaminase family protein [Niabella ginsenosidivorans]ANH83530.1 hypothetical protein A8C56_23405 [Niabella ginsenosidivorans]